MNSYLDTMETKRWMLVDDNEDILLMLSAMIERLTGAFVECHNSPASALAAFAVAPEVYELVVTDFEMPGMNGLELGRRLQALAPLQKLILASGNAYGTSARARAAALQCIFEQTIYVVGPAIRAGGSWREYWGSLRGINILHPLTKTNERHIYENKTETRIVRPIGNIRPGSQRSG